MIFLGDIHGEFDRLLELIENTITPDSNLFQVGDFGIGFKPIIYEKSKLEKVNSVLKEKNITMYVIRGNHDNPDFFNKASSFNDTNIVIVEDYTILTIEGVNILCIGGAVSIDRKIRLRQNMKYWRKEVIKEVELSKNMLNADVVVAHSSPENFFPYGYAIDTGYIKIDPFLIEDLKKERKYLLSIYEKMIEKRLRHWIYGHFHTSKTEKIGNCTNHLLDVFEIKEIQMI